MKNKLILQASAASNGNTYKIVQQVNNTHDFDVIDLSQKNIKHFDYHFKNTDDDFLPLITHIINNYNLIIFATPVYWYSMSGILKVFFDRLSDLLITHKPLGRKLRGKKMAMLSNSLHNDRISGFENPFKATANYLGMEYIGDIHVWFSKQGKEIHPDAIEKIDAFKKKFLL